jgi:hypothetical protein
MKEYCNLQGETISKYLSLSESLEQRLKEVNLVLEDWDRFKVTPEFFFADNEELYREYEETISGKKEANHNSYVKI